MTIRKNFSILAPLTIDAGVLQVGPPDAENQVYNAGVSYLAGDLVWYGGNVWQSLADSNLGNTPFEGASWTDLGEVDEGASVYSSGTTYPQDAYVIYQGSVWQSALSSNIGNTPSNTDPNWTRIGATNRFKSFDGFLQDEAALAGPMSFELQFAELVTEIAILRASGAEVRVTMTDIVDGLVYDETFPLIDDSAIVDAWEYCFAPFVFQDTILVEGLPPYAGATIGVEVSGEETSVAQLVAGTALALGMVRPGTQVGIESYSIKDRDDFNRSIVVQRPYSDTVDFDLLISTNEVGYVKRRLAEREALPSLYFMSEGAALGAIAYGFFQNFDILHSSTVIADCVLEIEGLG